MLTAVAFVVGLALLVGIHEYGHFRMAVACGVRVLRFSIGFGPVIWSWQSPRTGTEYALSAIPLGGYVRMLDEREAPVATDELYRAFNRKPLWQRAAVVAAGPLANLALAVALYTVVFLHGLPEIQPVLPVPAKGSLAERAGWQGAERVLEVRRSGTTPEVVRTYDEFRWHVTEAAMAAEDLEVLFAPEAGSHRQVTRTLPLSTLGRQLGDGDPVAVVGWHGPWTSPVIGELLPEGAAQAQGLLPGDWVQRVDGVDVIDGAQLRTLIRMGATAPGAGKAQRWVVQREGRRVDITITPRPELVNGQWVGRIGAQVGKLPDAVVVDRDVGEAFLAGVEKTWDVSVLSLRTMARMITGQASLKSLSGPITIADYAGKSASIGLIPYVMFLALLSVSLGVLNLLPLPVLDGGHLMYYLYEGIVRRPVPERWQEWLQRGGVAVLMGLMSLALFNDLARLLG